MKRVNILFLAAVLILSFVACGAKDAWQEQYDLGIRYLSDGNYQEAIIALRRLLRSNQSVQRPIWASLRRTSRLVTVTPPLQF